jgi:hypothetical protein
MDLMKRRDLIDFARRDRSWVPASRARFWRERKKRAGLGEGPRVAEELRVHFKALHPDWPGEALRAADLETHVRVGKMLRSVTALRSG